MFFLEKESTTPGGRSSAGRTPALCLKRPQVSGARVVAGCTMLTPFPGSPVYSASSRVPVATLGSLTPLATFPSSLFPEVPTRAIPERPSSQPGQNPERWNPSPGAPWRPLGMLRCQAGSGLQAACAPGGFLLRPRVLLLPSRERAHDGGRGGSGCGERQQRRRRRWQQQRHVQYRRGGEDAAPLSDMRRRRGRIHQQVRGEVRGKRLGRDQPVSAPLTPDLPLRPNLRQVAQKLAGKVGRDSESA